MWKKGDEPIAGYRLEKFLGRGQYGEVWQATAPGRTKAALKFIDLSGRHGLKELRGVMRVKEIRHAHLMPITALWMLDEDGHILADDSVADFSSSSAGDSSMRATLVVKSAHPVALIVAMLLGDKNLLDRLEEEKNQGNRGIPAGELLRYMEEAAKGIDFLNTRPHDLGDGFVTIQHCDIKPANIMLVGDSVLICDFGLARMLGGSVKATATGMIGSPAYMAPECIRRRPSHATDQYSLAITYFELRTGTLPFKDESYVGVLEAHQSGTLALDGLPKLERDVIRKATSVDPNKRYRNSYDMVRALRAAVAKESGASESQIIADAISSPSTKTATVGATQSDEDARRSTETGGAPTELRPRRSRVWSVLAVFLVASLAVAGTAVFLPEPTRDALLSRIFPRGSEGNGKSGNGGSRHGEDPVEHPTKKEPEKEDRETKGGERDVPREAPAEVKTPVKESPPPQKPDFAARRKEVEELLGQANRLLAQDDPVDRLLAEQSWRDAREKSAAALVLLEQMPEADSKVYVPQARLGVLRAEARQPGARWPVILDELKRISLPVDAAKGPLGAHASALEWIAAGRMAPADSRLTERIGLDRLVELSLAGPLLDPWEQRAIAELEARAWKELPALTRLDETIQQVERLRAAAAPAQVPRLDSCLVRLCAQRIARSLVNPKADPAALQKECERIRAIDASIAVVNACWVESRIATAQGGKPLDQREWFQLRQIADAATKQAGAEPSSADAGYVQFVAALVQHRAPMLSGGDAGESVLAARASRSPALETPQRRSEAAAMLLAASSRAGLPGDAELCSARVANDRLEAVYRYLRAARDLQDPPSLDVQLGLALAAAYRPQADAESWEESRRSTDALLADEARQKDLAQRKTLGQVRFVNAMAHDRRFRDSKDPASGTRALQQYASVIEQVRGARRQGQAYKDTDVYERLVAPALALADSLVASTESVPEDRSVAAAALYAARGEMILRSFEVERLFRKDGEADSGIQAAYDSYRRATQLHSRAAYLVGQGRALIQLPQDDVPAKLKELQRLAAEALSGEPDHPGGHGLQGYSLIISARMDPDPASSRSLLARALTEYDRAIAQSRADDEQTTTYYEDLSAAHLEMAFSYSEKQEQESKRKHLSAAESFARKAIAADSRSRPENAFMALGNALEDIAYYLGETDKYDAAIEAFTNAFGAALNSLSPTAAAASAAGRARFRKAQRATLSEAEQQRELEMALTMLRDARNQWQAKPQRRETMAKFAEACIWISEVLRAQAEQLGKDGKTAEMLQRCDEADQERGRGAEAALAAGSKNWPDYQVLWSTLAAQRAQLQRDDPEHRDRWLRSARERAQAILQKSDENPPPIPLRSDHLLKAVVAVFNATPEIEDRVRVIETNIDRFREDREDARRCRATLLISRCNDIVGRIPMNMTDLWSKYEPVARKDAETALTIAERLTDAAAGQSLQALGLTALGGVDYRVGSDPRTGESRGKLTLSARDRLQEAVRLYGADIAASALARYRLALTFGALYFQASDRAAAREYAKQGLEMLEPVKREHTTADLYDKIEKTREGFRKAIAQ